MALVCPDAWDTYFIILTFFFPSYMHDLFFSLSKATTKAFPTTIKKLVLFSFYPWVDLNISLIHFYTFFSFFAHSWGWVSDVHGLFLGLVLLEIEISVQKGQVLRVRSESDYTRAEQMTRVVGEVWVFGKGWVIGESTWPAGAYDGGLVTEALHDGWVTEGLMHDTLHTSPLPSISLMSKESHVVSIPLEACSYFKQRSASVNIELLWGRVAQVSCVIFIRFPTIPSVKSNPKPIPHIAQPSGTSRTVQHSPKQHGFVKDRLYPTECWVFEWERWVIVTTICGLAWSDALSGSQPDLLSKSQKCFTGKIHPGRFEY